MSLEKKTLVDKIEVLENGVIQIRESTRILEDEVTISSTFHRFVLSPGQDISTMPDNVKAICNAAWTPDIVSKYNESLSNGLILNAS